MPLEGQAANVIRIGRSPDSEVVLDFPIVSWNHAQILRSNGDLILEDVGSLNGTALNDFERVGSRREVAGASQPHSPEHAAALSRRRQAG